MLMEGELKLTQKRLQEILSYNPETGFWNWKFRKDESVQWNGRWSGHRAGSNHPDGYQSIKIEGKLYLTHRLAFLYMTGKWPQYQVDHRNRDRSDCRWSNLREATHSENSRNSKLRSDNRAGVRGVFYNKRNKNYRAVIHVEGKKIEVGSFASIDAARAAYALAAKKHHGEFMGTL